jgi:hypothetical protein
MIKKYKSKMRSMRIHVKVRGKVVPVEFEWDFIYSGSPMRGCSFTTSDVELQKALETHEYFNRKLQPSFWTDDVEEVIADAKEEVQDEPKKVKRYNKKG